MADLSGLSYDELMALKQQKQQQQFQGQQGQASPLQQAMGYGEAFAGGAITGLTDIGANIGNLEAQAIDKLFGTEFAKHTPRVELPQAKQQLMQQYPTTAAIGQFAGEAAPLLAMPEMAAGRLESLEPMISSLFKGAQPVARGAGQMAKAGGVGAALAPVYDPEAPFEESMPMGALLGQLGPIAEGTLGLGKSAFNSMKTLGGAATKKGAEKVMQAAENLGVKVPAAEVIKSPGLAKFQKTILKNIPGSGMTQAYDDLATGLKGQLEQLKSELNPGNVHSGESTKSFLGDKYKSLKGDVNDMYSNLRSNIEQQYPGDIHSTEGLNSEGNKILDELKKGERLAGADIKVPSDVKKFANQIKKQDLTLTEALSQDEIINDFIGEASRKVSQGEKGGKKELSLFNRLKSANLRDVDKTIEGLGSTDILSQWREAKYFYKDNIVPFDKKGSILGKIINPKTRPDEVQSIFLKTSGQQPKSEILEEVTSQLPQEIKDHISHNYLVGPGDESGLKMIDKYEKLQPKQRDLLFGEDSKSKLDDLMTIKKHVGKTEFNQMFVPQTGAQVSSYAIPAAAYSIGHGLGGPVGGLGALAGTTAAGKGMTKAVMSDALKKRYLKGLKGKGKKGPQLGRGQYLGLSFLGENNE